MDRAKKPAKRSKTIESATGGEARRRGLKAGRGDGFCPLRSVEAGAATTPPSTCLQAGASIAAPSTFFQPAAATAATPVSFQANPTTAPATSFQAAGSAAPSGGIWASSFPFDSSPGQSQWFHALPGGLVGMLQNHMYGIGHQPNPIGTSVLENFHFVGASTTQIPFSPPEPTPSGTGTPTGGESQMGSQETSTNQVNDDEHTSRSGRRLTYSSDEDIRLASAWLLNALDEYLKIGETTAVECLKKFVRGVIEVFGPEYLRRPTVQDIERLLQIGERRGFPGMIGSIDCMHWHWERCPVAWKGMYTRGDQGVPTVILEAFFGVAGSNNDINVLNQSTLFVDYIRGEAPQVEFQVNGRQYNTGYYLGDGIYPEWAAFLKSINYPQSPKHKLFAEKQEGARKDVECAFGILQSRWSIMHRPARLYDQGDLEDIMLACIILHNMIIEDEKLDIDEEPIDLNEDASTYTVHAPTVTHGQNPEMEEILNRNTTLHDRTVHHQLQSDMVEHIWQKFGPK